ncbi:redoxin domain-containing protein [Gammaproteobacteria bacterium]|nr:redoxin domain-containing protein [Gammaproteobacteria bacterium]
MKIFIKPIYAVALLLSLTATTGFALGEGSRVENFRLMDHQGASHELHYFADAPAIVLMTHSTSCSTMPQSLQSLTSLQTQFSPAGAEFMLINSDLRDRRTTVAASVADADLPILLDPTQIIGESLGADTAGETLVVNPRDWTLAYRGDVTGAAQAVEQLVAGDEVSVDSQPVANADCAIDFPELALRAEHKHISYAKTIAPMLSDNCVSCHREGGIGPWAMTDYNMVRGFSLMIREVVRTQRMPPWHADPHMGEFSNDRSLSDDEIRTLVHWVEAGAPRGEGADLLAENSQSWPIWAMGEPDVIIDIPPEDVPASGVVDYKYKMVTNPLDKDVWVKAAEIIPGDRSVLHHVITSFGELETEGRRAGRLKRGTGGGLGGYVPGAEGKPFPDDTGILLPAGATIEFQMHYTPAGLATTDSSRMGLYLYEEPPEHKLDSMVLLNPRILIPAGAPNHSEVMVRTFDQDVLIYSLLPHAHYRGKASEFVAHLPDGTQETLLSVPRYDFNWQTNYDLKEPRFLPAGTKMVHRTWWDNSARNPANPDATRDVPWGQQSWDEMLFGSVRYRVIEADAAGSMAGGQD